MDASIRTRLRSATKQDDETSANDNGGDQQTNTTAHRGGSEPGSLRRSTFTAGSTRQNSAVSLTSLFCDDGGHLEEQEQIRQAIAESKRTAAATSKHSTSAEMVTGAMSDGEVLIPRLFNPVNLMANTDEERVTDAAGTDDETHPYSASQQRTERWNACPFPDPAPQKYSWTGRSQYAAKGVMDDRLPLHPSIPENFVEDDVGVWVTFDVPPGHHLYGMFVPVDRTVLPKDAVVQRLSGNVFGRANKPTMKQIKDAVEAAQKEAQQEQVARDAQVAMVEAMRLQQEQQRENERNAQIAKLREELSQTKAALRASVHQPTAGGDASASQMNKKRERSRDLEATTAPETDVDVRLPEQKRRSGAEVSMTEYTTCAEDPLRAHFGEDGRVYHRRRKSRAERGCVSRSSTPGSASAVHETKELMQMFKECMKTTLETVMEARPANAAIPSATGGISTSAKTTGDPISSGEAGGEDKAMRAAPAYNTMMTSHPLLTITKFTGEN